MLLDSQLKHDLLIHCLYSVQSNYEDDQPTTAFFPGLIPSSSVPVSDLLPGDSSSLKTVASGSDNDVDIVGIFGHGQDTVFAEMPEGNVLYFMPDSSQFESK